MWQSLTNEIKLTLLEQTGCLSEKPNIQAALVEEVSIIVPVKDEEDGLEYLLEDFSSSSLKEKYKVNFIFVIDKRTSDLSKEFASKISNNIIDQNDTTGKGSAIIQAIENWKEDPSQKVIFLDADGSYSFESVLKILERLNEVGGIVSGSRFLSRKGRPEGMSTLHFIGNKALSLVSTIRNGRKISDLCSGLWGFERDALMNLGISSRGFDLEAQIAGLARKNKINHSEIQVNWSQRKGGMSKLRSIRDGTIIFLRILRT